MCTYHFLFLRENWQNREFDARNDIILTASSSFARWFSDAGNLCTHRTLPHCVILDPTLAMK